MPESGQSGSIFSQKLDRVAFIAYFLGAVVPLAALGYVIEDYVLPTLNDRIAAFGLIGAVASIVVLSLAAFLVLRTTTRGSLRQMDQDNRRLASLFETSGALSEAQDAHEVAAKTALGALTLSDARAVFVLMRDPGKEPQIVGSAGPDPLELYRRHEDELLEVAGLVMSEGRPVVRGANGSAPPVVAVPIPGEAATMGALLAVRAPDERSAAAAQVDSLATQARLASVALHNIDLRDAQRNFFTHVTDMLVSALDTHLGYHSGHSQRVAQLANRVGRELDLDEHQLQRLHFGALLHDIGMLKFDRVSKKDPLLCQKHAAVGYRMLNRIRLWQEIAPIVHQHHEWFDGSGYPEGLSRDAILLEARIIAACDAFDSMTSEHSYKAAVSADAALLELQRCAGTQFDPLVVEAFKQLAAHGAIEGASASV